MLESQKKANAKKQANYRKRHLKEGTAQRLNVILDDDVKLALERMAKHHGITNKDLLSRVLLDAQATLVEGLDDEGKARYCSPTPTLPLD
ncbi:hypothetical protein GALL_463560 [mine drainage metagenome]|uniref:Protein CopB n=1 Tax=mine drainage metagenome TaxID=410659 RepID=A0A1J5PKG9_9ZZZZ